MIEQNGRRDPPLNTEAFAIFTAVRADMSVVENFLRTVARPMIDGASNATTEWAVLQGQFLRLLAWCRTLAKLDEPADFQAVVSGCRALFEVAVDIALLCGDAYPAQQMVDWEEASKLKQARALCSYFDRTGGDVLAEHPGPAAYLRDQAGRIEASCQRNGWMDGARLRVPGRWTGNDHPARLSWVEA